MITDLVLHNYRQFQYLELKLSAGLVVIRGMNNAGKTTIQEAIAFALFGPNAIRDTAKSWVREGCKTGSVTLCLEVPGEQIRIFRSNTGAKLWINDREETQYRKEATAAIAEKLGINPNAFLLGYNIRQKEIDFFSALTKGRRRSEIERLLNISRVDNAISIVKGQLATKRATLDGLCSAFTGTAEKRSELARIIERINLAETSLLSAKEAQAALGVTAVELYKKQEQYQQTLVIVAELKGKLDGVAKQHKTHVDSIKELKHKLQALVESQEVRDSLGGAPSKLAHCQKVVDDLKALKGRRDTYDALAKQGKSLLNAVASATKALEHANGLMLCDESNIATITNLKQQLDGYEEEENQAKQRELQTSIDTLLGQQTMYLKLMARFADKSTCPLGGTCDSAIDPEVRKVTAEAALEQVNTELGKAQAALAVVEKTAKDFAPIIRKIATLTREMNNVKPEELERLKLAKEEAEAAYSAHEAQLQEFTVEFSEHDLQKAERSLKVAQKEMNDYTALSHVEASIAEVEDAITAEELKAEWLEEEEAKLQDELCNYTAFQVQYNELQAELETNRKERETADRQVLECTASLATLKQEEVSTKAEIKRQEEIEERINELQADVDFAEADILAFRNFKKYVGEKVLPKVREVAASLFHTITHNRYKQLFISEDYELKVLTHEGSFRSLKSISGSEEDVALLCLRLALSTLAVGTNRAIDFLMLDEITASFDNERTESTVNGLLALRKLYKQIFWITHKEVEENYADQRLIVSLVNGTAVVDVS